MVSLRPRKYEGEFSKRTRNKPKLNHEGAVWRDTCMPCGINVCRAVYMYAVWYRSMPYGYIHVIL